MKAQPCVLVALKELCSYARDEGLREPREGKRILHSRKRWLDPAVFS